MAIIIEGHDNSGKSTLAVKLAQYMEFKIQESEGPPQSDEEINERVDRYDELEDTVFVRHPVISNSIYGQFRPEGDPITEGRRIIFYERPHILIYCDAQRGYEGHQIKDHDSPDHLKLLELHQSELLKAYRIWAAQHAHFVYRIGDDMDQLVSTIYFFHTFQSN